MNIVICLPDRIEAHRLQDRLERHLQELAEESLLFCFSTAEELSAYLEVVPEQPDLGVISLDLADGDGISFIQELHDRYAKMELVISSIAQPDVEALFRLRAFYFLYAPIREQSVTHFLDHFEKTMFREKECYLKLVGKKGIQSIAFSDIFYVMSDKRKIIVYQPHGIQSEAYRKLDELETKLDTRFVRCHQSYLVNIDYIHGITNEGFTLIDEVFVPISQKRYWAAKKQYVQYIKSRG